MWIILFGNNILLVLDILWYTICDLCRILCDVVRFMEDNMWHSIYAGYLFCDMQFMDDSMRHAIHGKYYVVCAWWMMIMWHVMCHWCGIPCNVGLMDDMILYDIYDCEGLFDVMALPMASFDTPAILLCTCCMLYSKASMSFVVFSVLAANINNGRQEIN